MFIHWCLKSMKSGFPRAKVLCQTLMFCYQGLTLKNERMTLSRKLRRMYDQRLREAYRPIWSPAYRPIWPPALETAVFNRFNNIMRILCFISRQKFIVFVISCKFMWVLLCRISHPKKINLRKFLQVCFIQKEVTFKS